MKKAISLLLCVIMVLCCVPFAASADVTPAELTGSVTATSSDMFLSNTNYTVTDGSTFTVPTGMTLYVPDGCTLTIAQGARFIVLGTVVVLGGGILKINGFIQNSYNVAVNSDSAAYTGESYAQYRFPSLASEGVSGKIKVSYAVSATDSPYADLSEQLNWIEVSDSGENVYIPLNKFVYIKAAIVEEGPYDKYDDALFGVFLNQMSVPFKQGSHSTQVTTAGDITYSTWAGENAYLNSFNIYLPTGEGFEVYGREGEQSSTGNTVKLKYGQSFSFRVEIDPEYDMSSYEVYIYNGYGWTDLDTTTLLRDVTPATPDEYGYYTIPAVKGEHTIFVIGVVKNETLNLIGNILEMIRNIFEMFTSFFKQFSDMFGGILG